MPDPSEITQRGRLLAVFTELPFDVLVLDGFVGAEEISRPFRFEVRLLADMLTRKHLLVKPEKLIGQRMTISVALAGEKRRIFNGVVRRFSRESQDGRFACYRAELVPWFSLLSLTSDCRIFQKMTVAEIIEKVFGELELKDFRNNLKREYKRWDYCVQYRESDFNFLSRLMEQEGIFYYFDHEEKDNKSKHTLVLADGIAAYKDCPKQSEFRFSPQEGVGEIEDVITSFENRVDIINGQWGLRDFHFEMPRDRLEVMEVSELAADATQGLEIFDYPGEYAQKFNENTPSRLEEVQREGEQFARMRMEQEECNQQVVRGVSNCRAFSSGFKITLTSGSPQTAAGGYLLTSVQHTALQHPSYFNRAGAPATYDNSFTCISSKVLFRPARNTPKPLVHGPQTAIVIEDQDPPKEEIWPDKFGRVKVRFHWDREAKYACWIRVMQSWAGRGWGQQWIPRVGNEVVVDFLEGDPDAPIIIGSVYNSDNMPPFTLPGGKTQSGVKTRSSPKGGEQNFNMIRFEDKRHHECLEIHAELAMVETVEGSQTITVGGNRSITTGGEKEGATHGETKELVFKNRNLHVKGDSREKVDGKSSEHTVGDDIHVCGAGHYLSATGQVLINAKEIFLEGGTSVTLMAGGSSIVIGPGGITIVGVPLVKLNPAGAAPPVPPLMPLQDPPEDP